MKKLLASLSVVALLFAFAPHPHVENVARWAYPDLEFAAFNPSLAEMTAEQTTEQTGTTIDSDTTSSTTDSVDATF
ncbi:hypothetical protein [Tumebacillus flagellatus]|uniref:Secreted protein n=1 Tax=Tumebacillus flagellatus TaxID=1157490 RepID=A0A074MBC3_9BACL|nr:hypothetical protein [Tumebacillus flagellatus]KEO83237.1 hypothetical protein EL26_11135 [Tumebacillus flagellatus]